jgi:RimJ/RimL family protein N-acetyltransferase
MITIRDGTIEDIPFIKEMMWEAILVSPVLIYGNDGLERLRQHQEHVWNEWITKPMPVFIAVDSTGRKLGVLSLRDYPDFRSKIQTWEFGLGVIPEARRQGVAQRLLQHTLDFCREAGQPYLALTVDPTNRIAQALYRKMGFKITSKRHGVFEMRFSFEPLRLEDPEVVANRRYFIQYWTNAEYYAGRGRLHHCSPYHIENKGFRRAGLKPKDFVYVVTVIKGGLHLIVKYEVDRLLSHEEARAEFPDSEDFDPINELLITYRATLYSLVEPPIDAEVTQALQLLHKGQPQPLPLNAAGHLNGHSLRGVREITRESAQLLDGFVEIFRYFE